MRTRPFFIFAATALAVLLGILLGLGQVSSSSGNERALRIIQIYVDTALDGAKSAGPGGFKVADTPVQLNDAKRTRGPRYLVSVAPLVIPSNESKRIIIFCDTPFSDIPERVIFRAPPTHAVGYSDGTTGLISPADYARLNLSSFVSLGDLLRQDDERFSKQIGGRYR